MKAISLYSPHAQWVVLNWKEIETRTHDRFKKLAGQRIAIHVTQKVDEESLFMMGQHRLGLTPLDIQNLCGYIQVTRGKIIATVHVSEARWAPNVDFVERGEWSRRAMCDVAGKFCLFLEDVKPITPSVPFRGRQGIFNVPDELLNA